MGTAQFDRGMFNYCTTAPITNSGSSVVLHVGVVDFEYNSWYTILMRCIIPYNFPEVTHEKSSD